MKITIESTDQFAVIEKNGAAIAARVWEGETEAGTKVVCLIVTLATPPGEDATKLKAELYSLRGAIDPTLQEEEAVN